MKENLCKDIQNSIKSHWFKIHEEKYRDVLNNLIENTSSIKNMIEGVSIDCVSSNGVTYIYHFSKDNLRYYYIKPVIVRQLEGRALSLLRSFDSKHRQSSMLNTEIYGTIKSQYIDDLRDRFKYQGR